MNRAIAIAFLCLASLLLTARAEEHACKACGQKTYGTSVEWVDTPSDAANQAKKEEKLVFVLHVSGHFEDPGVT